ncbi:DUF2339 domain-containing protein [Hwanghaeella grinnelliae]|uniref:DUF2339 domain-containing protein n=1 Tax=Hwanghaeella grinnelliae TaxID=2500179 RepID=A0A437QQH0_9PROT|nr:DUF2339 domain-containing protein [Hwanghaeella grinnelliae]RVU36776.1 DUF2339 domain-containing protein [Hwanghaeella grinnelliae]
MFDSLVLLLLAAGLSIVATPIIAITAHTRIGKLRDEIAEVKRRLETVSLRQMEGDAPEADPAPEETPDPEPRQKPDPAPIPVPEPQSVPKSPVGPPIGSPVGPTTEPAPQPATAARADETREDGTQDGADGERNFATKWLVWLGGLTIALGGVFLVKYSIDNGLLTPAMRIATGLILSIALVIGGEWVRQKTAQRETDRSDEPAKRADYVPPALTGAGVATAFGSLYAGYALYGLISPLFAFAAMAGVCTLALGLSLLQGHFVAILGVIGGLAIPALVHSDSPSAWALFSYLTFIAGAAFAIVRYKDWWWLASITLLGMSGWQFLWIVGGAADQSMLPLYLHMVAVFAITVACRPGDSLGSPRRTPSHPLDIGALAPIQHMVTLAGVCLAGMTVFALMRMSHDSGAVLFAGLVVAILGGTAFRARILDALLPISAGLALAGLFTWIVPNQVGYFGLSLFDTSNTAELAQIPFSPEFQAFGFAAAAAGIWFAILGFAGIYRNGRRDLWAAISGVVPLATLFLAYAKLSTLLPQTLWSGIAMALACGAIAATSQAARRRSDPFMESVVGLYALAALSAIALSLTILLDGSWLTIALSFMILAAAWVNGRFEIAYLRPASAIVAAVVIGRLAMLNQIPFTLSVVESDAVWILYSYGLPAMALAGAARLFRRQKDDTLVGLLESGAIALASATVSLEIREFFGTATEWPNRLTLIEVSLHSLNWLISGTALYYRNIVRPRALHRIASRLFLGLGGAAVVGLQVLLMGPFTGEAVGSSTFINTLLIAYLAPAMIVAVLAYLAQWGGERALARILAFAAAGLAFLWINMEVRHAFHGTRLDIGPTTEAELYTYSIIWLLCAAPALILGLIRDRRILRRVGLGLVLLTTAKVFLVDMGDLDGLYRVISFLGLGFSLVGIGFLYQRFFK